MAWYCLMGRGGLFQGETLVSYLRPQYRGGFLEACPPLLANRTRLRLTRGDAPPPRKDRLRTSCAWLNHGHGIIAPAFTSFRGSGIRMPEQLANDGQAETGACTDACEGVPQIMKSETCQIGPFGNQRPRSLEAPTGFIGVVTP